MTNRFRDHSGARRGSIALATLLLGIVAGFQAALAAGAPWAAASYGGALRGSLPARYRAVSAASSLAYGALAAITVGGAGTTSRRRLLSGASGLMAVGALMNLASRSRVERLIWTPVAGTLAVTLLRIARQPATPSRIRTPS
jgi:hypothetical protein